MSDHTHKLGIVEVTSAAVLATLLGYLLIVGKALILPILIGIISAYILVTAAERLGQMPGLGALSRGWRMILVGIVALFVILGFVFIVVANAQAISEAVPEYSKNLTALVDHVSAMLGIEERPDLATVFDRLRAAVNFDAMMSSMLGGLTSFGTYLVTALLYAAFLLSDWDDFPKKTRQAFGDAETSAFVLKTAHNISDKIGRYLASKTLINLILGVISLAVMWVLGIEYAFFWAVLIALLNYIPYIGSIMGVMFPTALTLVQFGSLSQTLIALVALMAAQLYVGNVLEPRMLGRSVNMSPFIFLIALSFWMSVWGVVGAVLAIPLTSMIMIILAEIPQTRPIAVMMSGDGEV